MLYKDLDNISTDVKLVEFENELRDRFGPLPKPAVELLSTIRLRWNAEKLGFEKILLKNKRFIGYFVSNPTSHFYQSEVFSKILKYVQNNSHKVRLKEDKVKLSLTIKDIETVEQVNATLLELIN